MKKVIYLILNTVLLLVSCNGNKFYSNYNEESHSIQITEEYDISSNKDAGKIFNQFKKEPFISLFNTNAIFFAQLYYLSFAGEFDLYGVPYYDEDFPLFSSSNDDFLISPINIYSFDYQNDEYFVIYSQKSMYIKNSEEYRPNIEIFQLKEKTFYQIDNTTNHFSINGRVTSEWSAINDLYSGKVSSIFHYLDELTFLTNEIILSIAFLHYEDPLFINFRLIARFMSLSTLGVEYETESKILKYRRKSERRCSPSLSNCQFIYTLPSSNYSFDFQNLNYVNGVFDGSKYTETKHELKYNLHFNFSKELLDSLLEQKTSQAYFARLSQIYSQNSMSQRDQIKLFFLNF